MFLVFSLIFQHHEKVVKKSNDLGYHFFNFDLSHEAKKRVEYILVPEIMPDDQVYKGQTKLNMFSFLD